MPESLITGDIFFSNLILAITTLVVMYYFRKNISFVVMFALLITLNVRTFSYFSFGTMLWRVLGFERWVIFFGFILLGLAFTRSSYSPYKHYVTIFHLIYFVMIFASLSYSIEPIVTLQRGLGMVFLYGATFYGIYNLIVDNKEVYEVCRAMVLVALIINIIPWLVIKDIKDMPEMFFRGRYAGILQSPTGSAALNACLYPLALSVYHISRRTLNRIIVLVLVVFMYISYTRTATLALIVITIFYYVQYNRRIKYMLTVIAMVVITAGVLSFGVFGIWLPERLVRLPTLAILGGRVEAWQAAAEIISKRPMLGFGFGTEDLLFERFDYRLMEHSGSFFHNCFLGLSSQLGIPFTIFYFTGVFIFFFFTVRFTNTIADSNNRVLAIGLNTGIMCGIIYLFAESHIYSPGNAFNLIYFIYSALFLKIVAFEKME